MSGIECPDTRCPIPDTRINRVNNRPVHCGREFANTWFEAGVHQVIGVGSTVEVATVGGEDCGDVVADEGGDAVDIVDVGVEGGVAFDDAFEVSEFV